MRQTLEVRSQGGPDAVESVGRIGERLLREVGQPEDEGEPPVLGEQC